MCITEKKIKRIAIVSGGFDPITIGHVRMFKAAKQNADKLVVIINSDRFLVEKKGYYFYSSQERKELVRVNRYVDQVISCIDDDQTVCKTLVMLSDFYYGNKLVFQNGGDRTEADIAEAEVCNIYGIEMQFGIGGDKVSSSSAAMKRAADELANFKKN